MHRKSKYLGVLFVETSVIRCPYHRGSEVVLYTTAVWENSTIATFCAHRHRPFTSACASREDFQLTDFSKTVSLKS